MNATEDVRLIERVEPGTYLLFVGRVSIPLTRGQAHAVWRATCGWIATREDMVPCGTAHLPDCEVVVCEGDLGIYWGDWTRQESDHRIHIDYDEALVRRLNSEIGRTLGVAVSLTATAN